MWLCTSQSNVYTPGRDGVKLRGWPGLIDALKSFPMCTLCVSVSAFVNRTVWPRAIACTRGVNCKPYWSIRATSAGAGRSEEAFGASPATAGSNMATAGLIAGAQTSGIVTRPVTSPARARVAAGNNSKTANIT
jgi:hypothetical protein